MHKPPSSAYLLIEARLDGQELAVLVRSYRDEGLSWERIVLELHGRTGVVVTSQTLRNWFPHHRPQLRPRVSA